MISAKALFASTVLAMGALTATAANAVTIVTVEAAGQQTTTADLTSSGIQTFDGIAIGTKTSLTAAFKGGIYSGTYTATSVRAASQYGGATGVGHYNAVATKSTLTISGGATDYFGLFVSAIDGGNTVAFYKAGVLVDSVNLTTYALSSAYYGNPTTTYLGKDAGEKFAFFNFDVVGGYDKVVLLENGGGGFETDNYTVGVLAVPEPALWAMMITGFGLVGLSMRRRAALLAA